MIQFTEWLAKENQIRRFYRVMEEGSTEPTTLFEIHCDLSKGFTGMIDTFVNFLVLPGLIKQETSLRASLALAEDESPIFFSTFGGPANDGSTIINVMGREDVGRCLKVFLAGTDMVFRLRSASDQLMFQISLPNDHGFQKVYDACREAMKDAPRERTPISDIMDETVRDLMVDDAQKAKGWTDPELSPKQKFRVTQVSEAFSGRPLLHIEPAPISHDGWPDLSRELEEVIAPYVKNADNIALRYIDKGLPTTSTAVMGSVQVREGKFAIHYAVRTMIFETKTKKPGCNIHIRPEMKSTFNFFGTEIKRERIDTPPTYDFREVYQNAEESRDDLNRLVKIAHQHFLTGKSPDDKAKSQQTETDEESSRRKVGAREYLQVERTFAIVIVSTDDDPAYAVCLMNLDAKGEIDLDHEEFVLAQTATRDAALNYSMKLSNLLRLRVLEITKA